MLAAPNKRLMSDGGWLLDVPLYDKHKNIPRAWNQRYPTLKLNSPQIWNGRLKVWMLLQPTLKKTDDND